MNSLQKKGNFLSVKDFRRFVEEGTTAYRIFVFFTRRGQACCWGERFGEDILVSCPPGELDLNNVLGQLAVWTEKVSWKPHRVFSRQLVKQPTAKHAPVLVRSDGRESSLIRTVWENGLQYEIDFSAGYSVGFFCDQRLNRKILMKQGIKRLLNCFAYTCAFSVVAASVGIQTLSVDLSAKALKQGKRNFHLNGISATGHQFFVDEVFSVLKRLSRRGEKYDGIILDPPTFSRSAQGTFQIERDFPQLLCTALACAAPEARLLLSTNCTSLQAADLKNMGLSTATSLKIPAHFYSCEVPCDILGGPCASTVWMELK